MKESKLLMIFGSIFLGLSITGMILCYCAGRKKARYVAVDLSLEEPTFDEREPRYKFMPKEFSHYICDMCEGLGDDPDLDVSILMRENPKFDTKEAILALGTGEALVSFQNEKGEPEIVEKATILPPQSKMGVLDDISRNKVINSSTLLGKYDEVVERDSAFEELDKMLKEKLEAEAEAKRVAEEAKQAEKEAKDAEKAAKLAEKDKKEAERLAEKKRREAEKAKKNSIEYKLGKKVANKTADKLINKGLNTIFKKIFK